MRYHWRKERQECGVADFVTIEKGSGPRAYRRGAVRPRRRHQRVVARGAASAHRRRARFEDDSETSVVCSPAARLQRWFRPEDPEGRSRSTMDIVRCAGTSNWARLSRAWQEMEQISIAHRRLLHRRRRRAGGSAGFSRHSPRRAHRCPKSSRMNMSCRASRACCI